MHPERSKVVTAAAAVALLASIGLWAGITDDDASGRPPSGASPSVRAEPSDKATADESRTRAADSGEGTVPKEKNRKGSSGDGENKESPSPQDDQSFSDDPSPSDDASNQADDDADEETSSSSGDDSGSDPGGKSTPTPGTGETLPVQAVQTEAPVPLDSVGDFGTGLTVRLSEIASVQAEAKAPGEIAGPAVRVTVAATNDGDDDVSLDGVVVFVSYGKDRVPASQFGSSSDPLVGDLPARGARSGTYVYAVPPDERDDVRVEISYTGAAPTVAFEGSLDG